MCWPFKRRGRRVLKTPPLKAMHEFATSDGDVEIVSQTLRDCWSVRLYGNEVMLITYHMGHPVVIWKVSDNDLRGEIVRILNPVLNRMTFRHRAKSTAEERQMLKSLKERNDNA